MFGSIRAADFFIDNVDILPNGPVRYSEGEGEPWINPTFYYSGIGDNQLPMSGSPAYNHTVYVDAIPQTQATLIYPFTGLVSSPASSLSTHLTDYCRCNLYYRRQLPAFERVLW